MLKRVATALVLIPVVVAIVLFAPPLVILAVVAALTFISLIEYNRLTAKIYGGRGSAVVISLGGVIVTLCIYLTGSALAPVVLIAALLISLFSAIPGASDLRAAVEEAVFKIGGIIYISLPLSYFLLLAEAPKGRLWLLFFLIVIWCNDSLAYVFGRALGRRKLCPAISPGKTIEGAAGGIASGLVAACVFNAISPLTGFGAVVLIALVTGCLSIVGDLFESVIKRGAGEKDSGTIVPGHGGLLDRIDSIFFSLPALYVLAIYLKI